jgi:hypothetical protein
MLKKLASLLFEEEEVEEPAPKPSKKAVQEPTVEPIIPPKTSTNSFEPIDAEEPDPKPVEEPIQFESVQREPSFNDSSKPAAPKANTSKPTPSTTPYEFRPLISPIFGVSEHEQAHRPTFAATAEVQNDSHLQTVISPYYGAIHKDHKIKSDMAPKGLIQPLKIEEPIEPVQPEPIVENLALEALLEPESVVEVPLETEPEDHEQFSLFGDEQ